MIDVSKLSGKTLAVLMLRADLPPGNDFVVTGTAWWTDRGLLLDRGEGTEPLPVPKSALERVQPMTEEVRDHLGEAEYWLWMRIQVQQTQPTAQA